MGIPPEQSRTFKTNPVEIAIFAVVAIVFMNSAYRLVYSRDTFKAVALAPMNSNPVTEKRAPASLVEAAPATSSVPFFLNMDVSCGPALSQDTQATKVRLTGPLCGASTPDEVKAFSKARIVNGANKFSATIFPDTTANKFSTDYIPLESGTNAIQLEFTYSAGKTAAHEIILNRN